jgi:hypothetical protein
MYPIVPFEIHELYTPTVCTTVAQSGRPLQLFGLHDLGLIQPHLVKEACLPMQFGVHNGNSNEVRYILRTILLSDRGDSQKRSLVRRVQLLDDVDRGLLASTPSR